MNEAAIHATVVSIGKWGLAITGPSGSGKSDLALRLIDRGAVLVGDDYVLLGEDAGRLIASPASNLAGKLEIRGIGIVLVKNLGVTKLRLRVELGEDGPRFNDSWPLTRLGRFAIPTLRLNPFAASAPIKVETALQSVVDADLWPVPDFTASNCG
jgi:HPr kinase/phosphorylase